MPMVCWRRWKTTCLGWERRFSHAYSGFIDWGQIRIRYQTAVPGEQLLSKVVSSTDLNQSYTLARLYALNNKVDKASKLLDEVIEQAKAKNVDTMEMEQFKLKIQRSWSPLCDALGLCFCIHFFFVFCAFESGRKIIFNNASFEQAQLQGAAKNQLLYVTATASWGWGRPPHRTISISWYQGRDDLQ